MFTPGPWTFGPTGDAGEFLVVVKTKEGYGFNRLATVDAELSNAEANARLMASAPEMFAAIKEALDHPEVYGVSVGLAYLFKHVIAKAEGKNNG